MKGPYYKKKQKNNRQTDINHLSYILYSKERLNKLFENDIISIINIRKQKLYFIYSFIKYY